MKNLDKQYRLKASLMEKIEKCSDIRKLKDLERLFNIDNTISLHNKIDNLKIKDIVRKMLVIQKYCKKSKSSQKKPFLFRTGKKTISHEFYNTKRDQKDMLSLNPFGGITDGVDITFKSEKEGRKHIIYTGLTIVFFYRYASKGSSVAYYFFVKDGELYNYYGSPRMIRSPLSSDFTNLTHILSPILTLLNKTIEIEKLD